MKYIYNFKIAIKRQNINRTIHHCGGTNRGIILYIKQQTTNTISEKIEWRVVAGNRCYFACKKLMCSQLLSRNSKLKMYYTVVKLVVIYGHEAWTKV